MGWSHQEELATRLAGWQPGMEPSDRFRDASDEFWRWFQSQAANGEESPGRAILPSAEIQARFTGWAGEDTLLEGFIIYRYVRDLCAANGQPLTPTSDVLDFGCGWGRILRYFTKDVTSGHLHGTDVNDKMVTLCRELLPWASVSHNQGRPPTQYRDDSFDVIYAYSVFSHLAEPIHRLWLEEFQRLLRPGGLAVLSIRPRFWLERRQQARQAGSDTIPDRVASTFPDIDGALARYDAGEFCFSNYSDEDSWFGEASIPLRYVYSSWSALFDVVEIAEADGSELRQHLVVLRKHG
jgi:2-polyprenyl-3-methyl-5-hydroxy-6-metoxy-1,4-benzoquinol methylase